MNGLTIKEKCDIVTQIYDELDHESKHWLLLKMLSELDIRFEIHKHNIETGDMDKVGLLDFPVIDVLQSDDEEDNFRIVSEISDSELTYMQEIIKMS